MVKPKRALLVSVCIILVFSIIVGLLLAWHYWIRPSRIYDFALEDYTVVLEEFSSDEVVGPIADASDAREKGIAVLIDVYGEDLILGEKPFIVFYDKNTDAWMVCGSLPPILFILGGTAHIIINGSDGKVLAVWHEK